MTNSLNTEFEKAVRLIAAHFTPSDENTKKPILFHDIRVGVYLYENGYSQDIVLAGILHDSIEWSDVNEQILQNEFGDNILKLVLANTKNDSIIDDVEREKELINRCIQNGEDALIVKTADIIDSFKWYSSQNNTDELQYCMRITNTIFKSKPDIFKDKIFEELRKWQNKFMLLSE